MIIWQHRSGDNHYQVRSAGASIRLYRNEVFHSQYNGQRLLNGGVWDMLWLPLFFRPPRSIKRVLVLGVGAGAAVKKILDYGHAVDMTAIDIDAVHLRIARRFVGLKASRRARTGAAPNIQLIHADAIQWLAERDNNGASYDLIIDDLFFEQQGEPVRAVDFADNRQAWFKLLKRHLSPHGLLVANCVSLPQARSLVAGRRKALRGAFQHGFLLRQPNYDNAISVCSRKPLLLADWSNQLAATLEETQTAKFAGSKCVKQARQQIRFTQLG